MDANDPSNIVPYFMDDKLVSILYEWMSIGHLGNAINLILNILVIIQSLDEPS